MLMSTPKDWEITKWKHWSVKNTAFLKCRRNVFPICSEWIKGNYVILLATYIFKICVIIYNCEGQASYKLIFSSVTQSCPTFCNPMDCSTPVFPVHHQLPELTQTHVHWVNDAIQQSHPLSSPSPPAFNLSQHLGLFQCVSSSHQVAKLLEFQLQHQSFQWIFRADFL